MATKLAQKRLQKEFQAMEKSPPPFIYARFEEKNILDWHFILRGPPDSPYTGGEYHGVINFPSDYPFKPPDIKFFTPSGRFAPNQKICMSMTSYDHSWNAAWSVATILTGLLSFMLSDEITTGSVKTSVDEKKALAKVSHAHNIQNKKFRDLFPEYSGPEMKDVPDMGQADKPPATSPVTSQSSDSAPNGIADPRPTTGEVTTSSNMIPRTAVGVDPSGSAAIVPQGRGWQFLNLRWWAVAAFLAFVLSRLSTLGSA
ncbi:hypothetical protein FFLO_04947 [Filobasidium floriforme]|uniref:UBC core domain-containing protein n=1 Tax=Filobasidium floriforme TaxID=5210 RepID=A0A8K0JIA7_9TREE|nr:hypothetical protein FFLO_04947 [Filobasidium floriforme]